MSERVSGTLGLPWPVAGARFQKLAGVRRGTTMGANKPGCGAALVILTGATLGGLGFAYSRWFNVGDYSQRSERLLAELASRGVPMSADERSIPLRPGESNAEPFMQLASRSWRYTKGSDNLDSLSDGEALAILQSNQKSTELTIDASKMDRLVFQSSETRRSDASSGVWNAPSLAKRILRRATIYANRGQTAESLADLDAVARIGRLGAQERGAAPYLVPRLLTALAPSIVHAASTRSQDGPFLEALRKILATRAFSVSDADIARSAIAAFVEELRAASIYPIPGAGGPSNFACLRPASGPYQPSDSGSPGALKRVLMWAPLGACKEGLDVMENDALPPAEKLKALRIQESRSGDDAKRPFSSTLLFLQPNLSRDLELNLAADDSRKAALAYILVLQQRLKSGILPSSSLQVKGFPGSTALGKPIAYRTRGSGFEITVSNDHRRNDSPQVGPTSPVSSGPIVFYEFPYRQKD